MHYSAAVGCFVTDAGCTMRMLGFSSGFPLQRLLGYCNYLIGWSGTRCRASRCTLSSWELMRIHLRRSRWCACLCACRGGCDSASLGRRIRLATCARVGETHEGCLDGHVVWVGLRMLFGYCPYYSWSSCRMCKIYLLHYLQDILLQHLQYILYSNSSADVMWGSAQYTVISNSSADVGSAVQ